MKPNQLADNRSHTKTQIINITENNKIQINRIFNRTKSPDDQLMFLTGIK